MNDTDLAFLPAVEQATLLSDRSISSLELTEMYLRRIEQNNDRLGAYVTVAADQARIAARAADDRRASTARTEGPLPPLLGVPIALKDLNDTAGIRTTHGTAEWSDRIPDTDDPVVARLREAGCVFLGKTIVPEFGTLNVSEPPGYPPGRNPWDTGRSSGGSSGGSAAAVAAGLCAVAQGSDAGGSIRIPSSWSGCYGLKPTRGRVSWGPPPDPFLWINGPISRSVADAAAMLDVLQGARSGDLYTPTVPARPYVDEVGAEPGRLRIAVHPHPGVEAAAVAQPNRSAVDDTASLLSDLGHEVVEAAPEWAFDLEATLLSATIVAADEDAQAEVRPPEDTWDPWNQGLVGLARLQTASQLAAAEQKAMVVTRDVASFFSDVDLLITPTVAQPPPEVGWVGALQFEEFLELTAYTPFTGLWNLTGQPAASLPLALDDTGLPVGVQIVGAGGDEATILRVSAQIEKERPWADRRPPGV